MQQEVIEGYVLSPQQKRAWLHQQAFGHGPTAARCMARIDGALESSRLRSAIETVVARHEILRTVYQTLPGMTTPVQVVIPVRRLAIVELDLEDHDDAERETVIERVWESHDRLRAGRPFRACILRITNRERLLIFSLSSLSTDHESLAEIVREIAGALEASADFSRAGVDPMQYADFAEWHQQMIQSPGAAAREHWREQCDPASARIRLYAERSVQSGSRFEQGVETISLEKDRAAALQRLPEAGLQALLIAAYVTLLRRLGAASDLVVGVGCDQRRRRELQGAQGLYSAQLPFRFGGVDDLTFRALAMQAGAALSQANRWQEYFDESNAVDQGEGGDGPWSLPFSFEFSRNGEPFEAGGLHFTTLKRRHTAEFSKLKLFASLSQGKLRLEFQYDASVFQAEDARRIAMQFDALLQRAISTPDAATVDLSIVGEAEQQRLKSFNGASESKAEIRPIHRLFERQAERSPGKTALSANGRNITYAELNQRANRLARRLRSIGVGPETVVGLYLDRSIEMVVAALATLKASGAYLPIERAYPADRVSFILDDAGSPVLIASPGLTRAAGEGRTVVSIDPDGSGEECAGESGENLENESSPENLAYVIYTSGSTGRPKGVMIPHRGLSNYLAWAGEAYQTNLGNGAPVHSPLSFDLTVTSLWLPLISGGRVDLIEEREGVEGLIEAMRQGREYSLVKLTPAHLEILNQELSPSELASSSQALVIGGEALAAESLRYWRENAPKVRLINEYGPTETVVGCSVYETTAATAGEGGVPIGRPIGNTRIDVVDGRMRVAGIGVVGEIVVAGAGVCRGYVGRADQTAERFIPSLEGNGERAYRTGDLGRWTEEGTLEYVGRKDDQVKVRGYRIELGEVEAVIREQRGVKGAAATVSGAGASKRLTGYVALEGGQSELSRVIAGVKERLPEYMVPVDWATLDELPLTPNGKVDRSRLPLISPEQERTYQPPRTLNEELLAEIWADVLNVDRVGVNDNFFALGGDSIRSIQVRARAQQRGLNITHQDIFQRQTIQELARLDTLDQPRLISEQETARFSLLSSEDRSKLPQNLLDAYPLSKLQAGMIFHSEFHRESAVFHDRHTIRLRAPLDPDALHRAIEKQCLANDILRTSFDLTRFSEPLQLVHREATVPLEIDDLRELAPEEQEKAVRRWMETEKTRRFDWSKAPLLRFHVHRQDDSFFFTLSFHHAALDGWSAATLLTDLFQDYWRLLDREDRKIDRLDSSFRDFIALERQALASGEDARFWNEKLSDSVFTSIPRLAAEDRSHAPARVRVINVAVPDATSAGLKALARSASVPIKSVLLAAHLRVMSLLAGQSDVVTGCTSNGRPEGKDADRALGLFLNTLPMRLDLAGGTWADLVGQTFDAEREGSTHRWYPMAQIKEDLGGRKLFETSFTFLHYHVYGKAQETHTRSGAEILEWSGFEQTDFTLLATFQIDGAASNVRLTLSFDESLLSDEQMSSICDYYTETLARMAANPAERYDHALLLPEREQQNLLEKWSGGDKCFTPVQPLHRVFETWAYADPGATALSYEGTSISYGDLNRRSNQLAHYLRELGIGPEMRVGLCFDPSIEMIVALLGTLKAGGVYVPLDPACPEKRLSFILGDARVPVVLTQQRLVETISNLPGLDARVVCVDANRELLAGMPERNPVNLNVPDQLAYVIYTSGSTGEPKGAQVTHGNVRRLFEATERWFGFNERDVWTLFHSYAFDFSVWEIWGALLYGGRLVIPSYWTTRSPEAFLNLLHDEKVTVLNQTPSAFRQLSKADESTSTPLKLNLRWVIFGGEALDLNSLRGWFDRRSDQTPRLINMYGITETTVHVTYRPIVRGDLDRNQTSPIGVPIPDLSVYALDQRLNPVPIGVGGELYVGGAGLARGYQNRADLTAERFIPDPFSSTPGARLYKTGDQVRFKPDGGLEYMGRIDHQVKIRGFRIELGEIEAAISAAPGVREVVVTAPEDETSNRRLIAYVAPATRDGLNPAELREFLRDRLPDYMTPAQFILLDQLPMTTNGKVDRRKLPAPEAAVTEETTDWIAPRTPIEEMLAAIWAQTLRVSRVGAGDSFFQLGGHSLLATQMISQARQMFEIELPIRALFDHPRLDEFARVVEEASRGDRRLTAPAIMPGRLDVAPPLSFAQQRLWFTQQLDPASPAYNMPTAIKLKGRLDQQALEQALGEMVRRHESLRTTIEIVNGQPAQIIHPAAAITIPIVDLTRTPEPERDAAAQKLAGDYARKPFDLSRGPLFRADLIRVGEDEHVAVFVMHHIITDGWSLGVMVKELAALYSAFTQNRPSPLQQPPVQYADFALWQREWLKGESLDQMLLYWKSVLDGAPQLQTPLDRPRALAAGNRAASRAWGLSTQTTLSLTTLCRERKITPFMALLAAFQALLHSYSGQEDLVVGTDVAGRNRAELEPLIGFFVNQLVLRTDLSGDPTFEELLTRVRSVTVGAYAHQDLPFEKLVEALNPERGQSQTPLFQVKFGLQNAPMEGLELPGLTLSPLGAAVGLSRFDLFFNLVETSQGQGPVMMGVMEFNLDLFDPATIDRMLADYTTLIETVVQKPSARLGELKTVLADAEQAKRLEREKEIERIRLSKLKKITRKQLPELQPA